MSPTKIENPNEGQLWVNIVTQYAGRNDATAEDAIAAADATIKAFRERTEPSRIQGVSSSLAPS